MNDQQGDQRGVNGSLMKFIHKKLPYVPHSKPQTKPWKKVMKNTAKRIEMILTKLQSQWKKNGIKQTLS
jgi:hypothetical protein